MKLIKHLTQTVTTLSIFFTFLAHANFWEERENYKDEEQIQVSTWDCKTGSGSNEKHHLLTGDDQSDVLNSCSTNAETDRQAMLAESTSVNYVSTQNIELHSNYGYVHYIYEVVSNGSYYNESIHFAVTPLGTTTVSQCPEPTEQEKAHSNYDESQDWYRNPVDIDGQTKCLSDKQYQDYTQQQKEESDEQNNTTTKDKQCQSSIISPDASGQTSACWYNPSAGTVCNYEAVTDDFGNITSMVGVSSSSYCGQDSNYPDYDKPSPTDTDGKDLENPNPEKCSFISTGYYCEADRSKHCQTISGSEICDDGCINSGTILLCDPNRHPDAAGGDDSASLDTNGYCSLGVIYSSKGACEDANGTWTKDPTAGTGTDCSNMSSVGTCSLDDSSYTYPSCSVCNDAGGNWLEKDKSEATEQTEVDKERNELIAETNNLIRDGNKQLIEIKKGTGVISETIIKSGDATKTAIQNLGQGLGSQAITTQNKLGEIKNAIEDSKPEDVQYTKRQNEHDRSAIDALFTPEDIATVKEEAQTIRDDIQSYLDSAKAELTNIVEITVEGSAFEQRTLSLTYGDFDLSLEKLTPALQAIGVIIYAICILVGLFRLVE